MKHPGVRFDPNTDSRSSRQEEEQKREQDPNHQPQRDDEAPTASFTCFQCGGRLRIRLSNSAAAYRCPNCRAEFTVSKASESPAVFVVLPEARQFRKGHSKTFNQRKHELPKQVQAALSIFGLADDVSFEEVRSAYRELVKSYHPDMVAHLGPDLRRVAEAKTKEINSAYKVLEIFYEA